MTKLYTDHRIQKWLLAYASAALTTLIFFTASPALAQPVHVVALGASNTYGKGVLPSESYPAQLQILLQGKGIDAIVNNAGVNGDTTRGMLKRLSDVPAGTGLVILQPGGNDFRKGLGMERDKNIAEIVRQLEARGIRVLIMENDMLRAMPPDQKQADHIHLTPKGYAHLAEYVLPQVKMELGRYRVSEIRN